MKPLSITLVMLSLSVCACGGATSSPSDDSRTTVSTDADAVKRLESDYLAAWEAKRTEVRSLYADDAVLVMSDIPPRRGVDAISQAYERYAKNANARFDATPKVTIISEGGDLAYSQGTYVYDETDPKTRQVKRERGYYLLIFEKQPNGGWKVVQDVSSRLSASAERAESGPSRPIAAM
jgi:ketosteroid isomerase-like protein